MSTQRNAPCPCGSGKKYKKCCLKHDEVITAEQRAKHQHQQKALQEEYMALEKYVKELDELSNKANDLIRTKQWDAAYETCGQLQERYPEEIDGDERLSDYYKQQGDFSNAKRHIKTALQKAEQQPEKFNAELIQELKEEVADLDECIRTGKRPD